MKLLELPRNYTFLHVVLFFFLFGKSNNSQIISLKKIISTTFYIISLLLQLLFIEVAQFIQTIQTNIITPNCNYDAKNTYYATQN